MSESSVSQIDDLPHSVGPEPDYSESFYYQFGDPASGLNGFLRLSNRPNEGSGERTVCLFLPDGRVALSFDRPVFADPLVFDAGGMCLRVEEPLVAHRVSFTGEVVLLSDPWAMNHPRTAMTESPREQSSIDVSVRATALAQSFSLDARGDFTPNHYEQFVAVEGVIRVGRERTPVHAHGMRDRGWGPRSWQAPRFYRWLFGSREGFGFAAGVLGRDGSSRAGGFVWEGEGIQMLDEVAVRTTYDGEGVGTVGLQLSAGDRSWTIEGRAQNAVPLRHRRAGADGFTRILETSVLWSGVGGEMLGIAEYLDQVIDGQPVGIAEHDMAAR